MCQRWAVRWKCWNKPDRRYGIAMTMVKRRATLVFWTRKWFPSFYSKMILSSSGPKLCCLFGRDKPERRYCYILSFLFPPLDVLLLFVPIGYPEPTLIAYVFPVLFVTLPECFCSPMWTPPLSACIGFLVSLILCFAYSLPGCIAVGPFDSFP